MIKLIITEKEKTGQGERSSQRLYIASTQNQNGIGSSSKLLVNISRKKWGLFTTNLNTVSIFPTGCLMRPHQCCRGGTYLEIIVSVLTQDSNFAVEERLSAIMYQFMTKKAFEPKSNALFAIFFYFCLSHQNTMIFSHNIPQTACITCPNFKIKIRASDGPTSQQSRYCLFIFPFSYIQH